MNYDDTLAYSINNLFVGFPSFTEKVLFCKNRAIALRRWIADIMNYLNNVKCWYGIPAIRQLLREKLIYVKDYYIGDDYISYL